MKHVFLIFTLLLSTLCGKDITIIGSDAGSKLIPELVQIYNSDVKETSISIALNNQPFTKFRTTDADLFFKSDLISKGLLLNPNLKEKVHTTHPIGVAPIVAVVSKNLNVSNLTTSELQQILTGELQNWSTVGGPDLKIEPRFYGVSSLNHYIPKLFNISYSALKVQRMPGDTHIVHSLNGNDKNSGVIGFTSLFWANSKGIKPLNINGISPLTINRKYPMNRVRCFISHKDTSNEALQFVHWVMTNKDAQEICRSHFLQIASAEQDAAPNR